MGTYRYHGTAESLAAKIAELPLVFAGRLPDRNGAVKQLLLGVGLTVLGLLKRSFETKSQGGVDEFGVIWKSLAPSTLALRRIVSSPKKLAQLKKQYGGLSAARKALVHAQAHKLHGVLTRRDEKQRRHALKILEKKRKAGTITPAQYKAKLKQLQKLTPEQAKNVALAGAFALILRDTGRLLQSLSPALQGMGDSSVVPGPGSITISTNVPYAKYHDSDQPRKLKADGTPKLPRRQIFPDGDNLPASWVEAINDALQRGLSSEAFWAAYLG